MADEPLSPEEIDAIRERERNATGGDWRLEPNRDGAEILIGGVEYAGPRGWYYWLATGHCTAEQPRADGEFITKARRDVPRLLATVDALREERDRLAKDMAEAGAHLEAGLKALEAAGVVCGSGDRALEIIRAALNPAVATQAPAADDGWLPITLDTEGR